jgi:hypothetical protein
MRASAPLRSSRRRSAAHEQSLSSRTAERRMLAAPTLAVIRIQMAGMIDRPYLDPGTACQRDSDQERHHEITHTRLHCAENTAGYALNAVPRRSIPIGIRRGFRLRCPGVKALSRASPAFNSPRHSQCLEAARRSLSSYVAFTTSAITSAGYVSLLCALGIGDHLWVSRANFALADFSIGTKNDPPPHLIKFCTRHDFCVLRIAPAAFLPSPLVKHSAPPMLLPLSIWERA